MSRGYSLCVYACAYGGNEVHTMHALLWMMWMDIFAPHIEWVKFHYTSKTKAHSKRKIWYMCSVLCLLLSTVNQLPFAIYKSLYHVYKLRYIRFNMWGVLVCMFVLLSLCVSGCVELQLKIEELVLYSCKTQCLYTAPAPHPHKHVMMMMMVEQTKHETKKKWRSHLLCELNTSISHYIYM